MSNYFFVEPEVAGGLGEHTIMDRSTHPPRISKLEYEFDGWSGDQLVESFPCYIVANELADQLIKSQLTGFELAPVEISITDEFEELYPDMKLPPFHWLKITGQAGHDDFGIAIDDWRLVVSERALAVVEPLCPNDCDVSGYPQQAPSRERGT